MKRRTSRLVSILLALCMALALLPGTALAAETSGYCGDGVTWSSSDGVLTIEGTGDMQDNPWWHYSEQIHTGDSAFYGCSSLTDVYYGGSESQWKQIDFQASDYGTGNNPLLSAAIHYNSAAAAPPANATPAAPANISAPVNGHAVADAMGLDVNWDGDSRVASFSGGGGKTIFLPIDSGIAFTSDGKSVKMDTAAVIRDGRTYAPVRYLAEYFGYSVGWDAAARTAIITG